MKIRYLFYFIGLFLLLGCFILGKNFLGDYDYYFYFLNIMDKFVIFGRFVGIGKKD